MPDTVKNRFDTTRTDPRSHSQVARVKRGKAGVSGSLFPKREQLSVPQAETSRHPARKTIVVEKVGSSTTACDTQRSRDVRDHRLGTTDSGPPTPTRSTDQETATSRGELAPEIEHWVEEHETAPPHRGHQLVISSRLLAISRRQLLLYRLTKSRGSFRYRLFLSRDRGSFTRRPLW